MRFPKHEFKEHQAEDVYYIQLDGPRREKAIHIPSSCCLMPNSDEDWPLSFCYICYEHAVKLGFIW